MFTAHMYMYIISGVHKKSISLYKSIIMDSSS